MADPDHPARRTLFQPGHTPAHKGKPHPASGLIRTKRPSTDAAPDPAAITRTPTGIKEVNGNVTRHTLT